MAPYYVLKLAQDSGSHGTVVQSWLTNQFHPNQHHFTYVMDWHEAAGVRVEHLQYLGACEAENAQMQQQLSQHGEVQQQQQQPQQQEDQDAVMQAAPAADAPAAAAEPAAAAAAPAVCNPFWLPDPNDADASSRCAQSGHTVVGHYVISAMESPQKDPSVQPIHDARADPRGKVVSLEDCVEAFLQPEQLSEADEWYCPKCKSHVQVQAGRGGLPTVLIRGASAVCAGSLGFAACMDGWEALV
jgi:hypothetical protein